jgi:hypothetical protein
MSTKYFLLTKNPDSSITNNDENQIIYTNRQLSFILPEINLDYYYKRGLFESSLIEWCKQFCSKDGLFLDIGAHTGTYSISLANHCKTVFSFEPQKMTYYALCGSVALSNIHNIQCFQIGLGSLDQVGKTKLKIRSNDGGGSSICSIENVEILAEEEIIVQSLDGFFEMQEMENLPPIEFIKMDVEYNELNVLKGGIYTLEKNNYPTILLEANTDSDLNKDLFDFLENVLSYKVVSINGYNNMFLAVRKDKH